MAHQNSLAYFTEIQRDLDRFLEYYNLQRSHQGYRPNGRTPAQALMEALNITELPKLMEDEPTRDSAVSREAT